MKILFTGGGSGGHVYPAIALIKKLKSHDKNLELLYIGKIGSYEERICKKEHIPFRGIKVRYLYRKLIYKNILTIIDFIKATKKVKEIINEFEPEVVIGTGGYVCAPVIYMSSKMNIKTIIHEQNSVPGLTNRILSRYVDVIAISLLESKEHFKHDRIVLTGNPRANEVINVKQSNKNDLGLSNEKKFLLIFFGSQGAKYVNLKIADIIPVLDQVEQLETIFVTGKNHYEEIMNKLNGVHLKHTKIRDYLDNMPDYLTVCDLVVSRAGATTLSELTALNIPAIYIPSPYVTNNHQEKNANIIVKHKAGVMIKEKDLTNDLLINTIKSLILNDDKLKQMSQNNQKVANTEGINQFIDVIYN